MGIPHILGKHCASQTSQSSSFLPMTSEERYRNFKVGIFLVMSSIEPLFIFSKAIWVSFLLINYMFMSFAYIGIVFINSFQSLY